MTCVSLFLWWWLAILDPTPRVIARFDTAEACWRAHARVEQSFTLDGR